MHRKDSLRARRRGLFMACALATALISPSTFAHSLVSRFDEAVARTLPVTLASRDGELVVRDRIRADVTYSDGRPGQLFAVTWRGTSGLAVREGDGLRVIVDDGESIRSSRFDGASDEVDESARPARSRSRQAGPIDRGAAPSAARRTTRASELRSGTYTDLYLFIYVQDGIEDDDESLFGAYLADFTRQLSQEHFVGLNVHVRMRRDVPHVTTRLDPTENSLSDWRQRVYANPPKDESPDYFSENRLNLLVVNTRYAQLPDALGVAEGRGDFAIASIHEDARVPAHELGHLLDADHHLAETVAPDASGQPRTCVTTMWPHPDYPACGWFSPANIEWERQWEEGARRFSR
ncbi:hypothetical protein L2Y94_04465 [Luteibacter aegosomatis]|uniref:hypothetical protein n=1 Tax=Luteibacter aegosomatis TaxID=2911537 RepID=UPI001FF87F6B|nr:hypothetical protein [Luteibacter aegosomatis]UPG86617.1 hypothetical protein L2Y94_04465 [Luteibacter aegosomatis]